MTTPRPPASVPSRPDIETIRADYKTLTDPKRDRTPYNSFEGALLKDIGALLEYVAALEGLLDQAIANLREYEAKYEPRKG